MHRFLPSRSEYYLNDDVVSMMDDRRDQGKKRLRNRFTSAPVVMNTPNVIDAEEYHRTWGETVVERGRRIFNAEGVKPLRELFGQNQFRSGTGGDGEYRNAVKQRDINSGLTGVGIDDKYLVSSQKLTGGRNGEQQVYYFVETQYNSIRWSLKNKGFADPKNARKHCTCPDFTNHRNNDKNVCKHIVAVEMYEAANMVNQREEGDPLALVNEITDMILTPDQEVPTTEVISLEDNMNPEGLSPPGFNPRGFDLDNSSQESFGTMGGNSSRYADELDDSDEYRFSQDSLQGSQ
jgi:hypothetical protein